MSTVTDLPQNAANTAVLSYCQLVKSSDGQLKFTCNRLSVGVQLTDRKCKSSTVIKYFIFCGACNSDECIPFHLAVRTSVPYSVPGTTWTGWTTVQRESLSMLMM